MSEKTLPLVAVRGVPELFDLCLTFLKPMKSWYNISSLHHRFALICTVYCKVPLIYVNVPPSRPSSPSNFQMEWN